MGTELTHLIVTGVLALGSLAGCGGAARLVRRDPNGGEIAMSGMYMEAAAQARLLMAEHCNGRFAVLGRARGDERPRLLDAPNRDQNRFEFACIEHRPSDATLAPALQAQRGQR